ncbi:zinc finger protein 268 isoform X7 [Rhinolophus sinicus]|uniref:zinc finger protein 268 isoform X7 n=1 Tax=Rhinolophus sinicus TaxID=89399 RepID=UPI003D7B1406
MGQGARSPHALSSSAALPRGAQTCVGMATRVRTAAIWVPPLQEGDSPCGRTRRLLSQQSVVRQGTPAQSPLTREPQPRHKGVRTEQVLEWLFSSQEQPKTTTSQDINTPNLISSSSWNKRESSG